jgi:alanyl-tRNA synthetase
MPTEKLYWSDPHLTSFETHGASFAEYKGKPSLVLDRTLFYPEGGGQLGDRGTLLVEDGPVEVADTQIDEGAVIHHLLAESVSDDARARLAETLRGHPAATIKGSIDGLRRRDHMSQHTGQHALSRALADVARADTVSARLGVTTCTIDVTRATVPDADLHRVEDLVNGLVATDVAVRALYPAAEELPKLPLRKQPKLDGADGVVRIIDIEGFDMTPCGGTHCTRTGQIGQVRIVGLEKYKGMLRITFHAGLRALADARAKHEALAAIAADLTCGVLDVPGAVTKLRADLKSTRTQLDAARAELARVVARALLDGVPSEATSSGMVVLPVLRANDDVGTLRLLAGELATDPRVVALAAAVDPTSAELVLVVQRGAGATFDCGRFMQRETRARGGRGGGRADRAEGRFPPGTSLDVLADAAGAPDIS